MGNCCSSCFEVIFHGGYQRIPETEPHETQDHYRNNPPNNAKLLRGKMSAASEPVLFKEKEEPEVHFPLQLAQFYDLGPLVGVGTTSKVYKVHRRLTKTSNIKDKSLACKVIDKRSIIHGLDSYDVEPLLEQLCKEVEILKRIRHPNIVKFYDYMETKDRLFIITERLGGGELFDYILNNGPLNEAFACQVLFGAFSAVAYLHERGVIHRDIKAENLIFCKGVNGESTLKLIDFGFSTVLGHDLTGSFMGTGGYIAPEIRQSKNYSTSVDSWSLGVLLYCSLSAKLPFGISIDTLPGGVQACQGAFSLTFPPVPWANISVLCKDLISKLLELDPIKRCTAKEALGHPWVRIYSHFIYYILSRLFLLHLNIIIMMLFVC